MGTAAREKIGMGKKLLIQILRIVPLALYLRSAACKFGIPIGGCDGPLCPVAIGKAGDCVPTANTAEQLAWCQHAWTPWANGLLAMVKVPLKVRCSAARRCGRTQLRVRSSLGDHGRSDSLPHD